MAGIYIHIPFCKSRCIYCDFFSTTMLERRKEYVSAILQEIGLRSNYLNDKYVHTIYFGGGTPSLLDTDDIGRILNTLAKYFEVDPKAEITLEANPGDLSLEKLHLLYNIGVNRLSIGIQTFHDDLLQLIGRRHSAQQARDAVLMAKQAGFNNISIDLIYALPGETLEVLQEDIQEALALSIQHISTYCLTYEPGTPLTQLRNKNQIFKMCEDSEVLFMDTIRDTLTKNDYKQYEVSNYCINGYQSIHNSSYWDNIPYLGLGAGAHSYDMTSRQWNVSDLDIYINSIKSGTIPSEKENLEAEDQINEKIMLRLRTSKGLDLSTLTLSEKEHIKQVSRKYIEEHYLQQIDNWLRATQIGQHILNRIIEDLMI